MPYQQVRDVVAEMSRAHRELHKILEHSRSPTEDERTQLMLKALSREEKELQVVLSRYGKDGTDGLLDTWLQYVPDEELKSDLAAMTLSPDMPPDEIVARKLKFDDAMMEMLKQLKEQTAAPRVQEFFSALLENAESRASQEAWSVREYQPDGDPPQPDK